MKTYQGDYQNWKFRNFLETLKSGQNFYSYEAAINKSNLLDVEKFNYSKTLVIGEAANSTSGLSLTNNNYGEAMNTLKVLFGDKQIIMSSNMNSLLKLALVKENDLQ